MFISVAGETGAQTPAAADPAPVQTLG